MDKMMSAEYESFSCRLCGSAITLRPWLGGECQQCGSVSMRDLPTREEIRSFYQTYAATYVGGGSSGGRNQLRYANRYLKLVRQYAAPTGRLIDVGSSTNPFPNIAADAGFDTTAMDFVRPGGLSYRVQYLEGNLNEPKAGTIDPIGFDIVTSWAVMEHLPDPKLSASILASFCRPGGFIILSTPEIGTALTRNSIGHSRWFYPPEHLCLISPLAIKVIFQAAGCKLVYRGRLEISPLRYLARYGVGLVEAIVGLGAKLVFNRKWVEWRDSRRQAFQGISYFVFQKESD